MRGSNGRSRSASESKRDVGDQKGITQVARLLEALLLLDGVIFGARPRRLIDRVEVQDDHIGRCLCVHSGDVAVPPSGGIGEVHRVILGVEHVGMESKRAVAVQEDALR